MVVEQPASSSIANMVVIFEFIFISMGEEFRFFKRLFRFKEHLNDFESCPLIQDITEPKVEW